MLSRLRRVFRHRWAPDSRQVVDAGMFARLQSRIAASEAAHSGEIRICIESGLPNAALLTAVDMPSLLRRRALLQFSQLGVWDTADNNGVLIYLCLAERAIELVADRGLNPWVPAAQWSAIVARLAATLRQGAFEQGLTQSVEEVHALLVQHFPVQAGASNPNELADAPVLS